MSIRCSNISQVILVCIIDSTRIKLFVIEYLNTLNPLLLDMTNNISRQFAVLIWPPRMIRCNVSALRSSFFNQAVSFIKKWQKAIQPRLTEEDYRLAKVSASLRVEEFKELRKKNAKVWHGHLAGMPLADVLEADLMEVSLCIEDARVTEADGQNSELVAA